VYLGLVLCKVLGVVVSYKGVVKRPSKIRSKVTAKSFRKFRPRVLGRQELLSVGVSRARAESRVKAKAESRVKAESRAKAEPRVKAEPRAKAKPRAKVEPRVKAEPRVIVVKKPRRLGGKLDRPPVDLRKDVLRQQLSCLRKKAAEVVSVRKVSAKKRGMVKAQQSKSKLRGRGGSSVKQIEGLRNIGLNRVLVMVAAGPSVLEVDLMPLSGHRVIDFMCINKPYVPLWPTRFWAFCDHTQHRANIDVWDKYDGIIINSPNVRARKPNQIIIRTKSGKGFSVDVSKGYYIGRSSTYAAMQVVYYMAYRKVFLFGVDMCGINGKFHFYGQNPDVPNNARESRFPAEAQHYLWAGQNLPESVRDRFVFCSSYNPWPFLKYFTKWDHKEAVQKILDYVDEV
jgi:hypothetical protein